MIDLSKIKMPEIRIDLEKKGWFKGLGLHHAIIAAAIILLGHSIGLGKEASLIVCGWYASREYGGGTYPPKSFEVMDFLSPLTVAIIYNLIN